MRRIRQPKLSVEWLEPRDCPSFVLRLMNGTLFVTGSPTHTGTPQVLFTQTANNRWQVQDGTTNLGTYSADSIDLSVTEHNNVPIVFNLNGNTDSGNILINLGNGNSGTPSLLTGTSVYNGVLAGNLTLLNGSSHEFITLGYLGSAPSGSTSTTIGGNVLASLREGTSQNSGGTPTGNLIDTGTEPFITPAVTIGGSITANGVNALQLAQTTTVGKDVTVTTTRSAQVVGFAGDLFWGTIGGNLTVNGAPSSSGDFINIGFGTPFTATIGGNVNINLGNGNNQLQDVGPFVIGGSTNIRMGSGNSSISLGGTIGGGSDGTYNGNLSVQLGDGNNTDGSTDPNITSFGDAGTFIGNATVGGNFSLTAGNGNNTLTQGGAFGGTVNGATFFTFGNGTDSIAISSSSLGGLINWHSGNGNDSLTFTGAPTPTAYNVNAVFGNLDDVFTFDDANSSLSGSLNGGGRVNGNVFNFVAGTIVQPFTLSNFP